MKIKYALYSLMATAVFSACQDENELMNASLKISEVAVTASRENTGNSRTTLTDEYKINWHADDQLSVFLGSAANTKFTIHEGAGEDYATFKGNGEIYITGGSESASGTFANVAYYPYSESLGIAQGDNDKYTITASWPSAQTYKEGSFGQDAYPMVAVAESNRDYAFSFKNVGSMFMLYLKGDATISKIKLQSQSNKLAGACTVEAAYGQNPVLTLDESSAGSEIILNCPDGVQLSNQKSTVFVIAVPPISGEAEDLTFTIYDTENGYMVYENAAGYSVERTQYYTFGATTAIEYVSEGYAEDYVEDATGNVTIYSESGLSQFVTAVNEGDNFEGKTIALASDLNLSTIDNWTPIANGARSGNAATGNIFKGIFDGQNHTISGLAIISGEGDNAVGLFGVVDGGTIKNLKLADVNINVPNGDLVGAVAGFVTGGGMIENVTVSGEITANKGVGGVIGRATVSAIISKCENTAAVNATSGNAGGIVGAAYYTAADKGYVGATAALAITDCKNTGNVTTSSGGYTGGIVGLSSGCVTNCENTGEVTGNNTSVGGIVGEQKEAGEVTGCANSGTVANNAEAYGTGGIIGWVRYPASEAGSGKAYEKQNVIIVKGNINTASVNGGNDAGGIVGTVYNYAVISDNNNSAATLEAKTFAAGIVGNVQFDNDNVMEEVEKMVEITNNTSTTALSTMTVSGLCKAPYAYDNSQGTNTKISGNGGCPDAQSKEQVADGVIKLDDTTYELSKASGWSYFAEKQQNGVTIHIVENLDFIDESEIKAILLGYNASLIIKGNGHTISNAKVVSGDYDNTTGQASMFYCHSGSTLDISDLTLENITVTADDNDSGYAAAVVGYCEGAATLSNVDVVNAAINGAKSSGMLVGHLSGSLTAKDCDVSGTITLNEYEQGGHYAGEYVGTIAQVVTLTNCTADVSITGNTHDANVGTLYGRIVTSSGGSLVVDGKAYVTTSASLGTALQSTGDVVLSEGEYTLPAVSNSEVTITGTEEAVITINSPAYHGSDVTLNGVTVKGSGYATGIQHVETVTYNDVTIKGDMCLYGEKVVFNGCTFDLNNQYIWTYGAKVVEFEDCTFNTTGKAILIYNEGAGASHVTVKNCTFNATASATASAIANQNCAAIEIDNFQSSGTGTEHSLSVEGNTYDDNFSGEWRIKNYVSGGKVIVNGEEYTSLAIDGKTMTIDANKNVIVED